MSDLGKLGRADTKSAADPNRETPDTLGLLQAEAKKKFEPAGFDAVHGGAGQTDNTQHGGHGDGHGPPTLAQFGESRGIKPAGDFSAVKGHGVAKRGPGKATGTDEETRRKLSTAGS